MREEISSFDLAVIVRELRNFIKGTRINKIYQINRNILLLKLRNPKGDNLQLLIEAGKRMHITFYDFEKPKKPPNFCMALRKHLENGIIEEISQYDFERIAEIKIRRGGQNYRLIIEFFKNGNIILVNSENKILQALTYRRMRDRNILRGEIFKYPPRRGEDPRLLDLKDFYKIRDFSQMEIVRALTRFLAIGGFYAEEILLRSGVNKSELCSSLNEEKIKAIFDSIKQLIFQIESGEWKPCVFFNENNEIIDFAPFPLKRYVDLRVVEMESFNRALDEYYAKVTVEKRMEVFEKTVEQEVSRLKRILEKQKRSLQELENKIKTYQQIGNIIYSHLYDLDSLINRIMREKKKGKSWNEISEILLKEKNAAISPSTYFVSINPKILTLQVSVDGSTFNLNLKQSAQENAADYYEKAKKAKDKIEGIKKAMEQTMVKLEKARLEALKKMEAASKPLPLKRKKEWYEKFRWFISSEGFLVIGGRDASTNETLIKKYLEPHDLVFHADIVGSPFVVIKTGGKAPAERTINEAAQFTASYSRAWREGLRALDVYWVKPEQVKKAAPSGQYLSKGSFMIYGTKNYVKNVPLEVAIGVKRENNHFKVIGGPVEAIAKQTSLYVKIVPGKDSSGRLAKYIRNRLASMASNEERNEILRIPIEDFQAFIPSGRGSPVTKR